MLLCVSGALCGEVFEGGMTLRLNFAVMLRCQDEPVAADGGPAGLERGLTAGVRRLHKRDCDDRADEQQRHQSFRVTRKI